MKLYIFSFLLFTFTLIGCSQKEDFQQSIEIKTLYSKLGSIKEIDTTQFKVLTAKNNYHSNPSECIWFQINLNNSYKTHDLFIRLKQLKIETATLFYTHQKELKTIDLYHLTSKESLFNHYETKIDIPEHYLNNSILFLKIKTSKASKYKIDILSKTTYEHDTKIQFVITGFLIGCLILNFLYHLLMSVFVREPSYMLCSLAILTVIFTQSYLDGFFNGSLYYTLVGFATGTLGWFVISYIKKQKLQLIRKNYYNAYFMGIALFIAVGIFQYFFLNGHGVTTLNLIQIAISTFLVIYFSIKAWNNGQKNAIWFAISWLIFLLGFVLFILKSYEYIPSNTLTNYCIHFGTFLQVSILSAILGMDYSLNRNEKEELALQSRLELEALVNIKTRDLEASVKEKEVLLKEMHHRVKNNLQIVISLLDLQSNATNNRKSKAILTQSKSRVYSMSLIHQKLYQSDNLAKIQVKEYIEDLFEFVKNTYHQNDKKIHFSIEIDAINLSIIKAVPLGLIINELLTNSFKYGISVASEKENYIWLSLKKKKKKLVLSIKDSGPGFDENTNKVQIKSSLGLFLVATLKRQLKGKIIRTIDSSGFETQLFFQGD